METVPDYNTGLDPHFLRIGVAAKIATYPSMYIPLMPKWRNGDVKAWVAKLMVSNSDKQQWPEWCNLAIYLAILENWDHPPHQALQWALTPQTPQKQILMIL